MESSRLTPSSWFTRVALTTLFIIPLLTGLSWGTHFNNQVYVLLSYARNLANGNGLIYDFATNYPAPLLMNPLYATMSGIFAGIGLELVHVTLIMSITGWIGVGLAYWTIGRALGLSDGSSAAILLISFNPVIVATLGGPESWVLAIVWISAAFLLSKRSWMYALMLFMLFSLNINVTTLILALLFGTVETRQRRGIPWYTIVTTTGGVLLWLLINRWQPRPLLPLDVSIIQTTIWTVSLFLAGVGIDYFADILKKRKLVNPSESRLKLILLASLLLFIGAWQGMILRDTFRERPLAQWELEMDIAAWIKKETADQITLFAPEKIGYLAGRPTRSTAISGLGLEAQDLLRTLQATPVDYLVGKNDLVWQHLTSTTWFRLNYGPAQHFEDDYAANSPYTIWAYRPPLDNWSERQALNIHVPDRFDLIGYQFERQQVRPGEQLRIALYLQGAEATILRPEFFQTIVRLVSPVDNSTLQEWQTILPDNVKVSEWQSGQVILEKLDVPIPEDLPIGAYLVNLSIRDQDEEAYWALSRDNDINPLDRVTLDYISVPWMGGLDDTQPLSVTFADQILLVGFKTSAPQRGQPLQVHLYWQALRSIDENYVVFVHFLDENGLLIANHDSIPLDGRFPTIAWQAEDLLPDEHLILLPSELPSGEYQLKAGLYLPDNGQRLVVLDENGIQLQDNAALLAWFTLP